MASQITCYANYAKKCNDIVWYMSAFLVWLNLVPCIIIISLSLYYRFLVNRSYVCSQPFRVNCRFRCNVVLDGQTPDQIGVIISNRVSVFYPPRRGYYFYCCYFWSNGTKPCTHEYWKYGFDSAAIESGQLFISECCRNAVLLRRFIPASTEKISVSAIFALVIARLDLALVWII